MKNLNYMSIAEDAISKIKKGAFLTVKAADALNTMTIYALSTAVSFSRENTPRICRPGKKEL